MRNENVVNIFANITDHVKLNVLHTNRIKSNNQQNHTIYCAIVCVCVCFGGDFRFSSHHTLILAALFFCYFSEWFLLVIYTFLSSPLFFSVSHFPSPSMSFLLIFISHISIMTNWYGTWNSDSLNFVRMTIWLSRCLFGFDKCARKHTNIPKYHKRSRKKTYSYSYVMELPEKTPWLPWWIRRFCSFYAKIAIITQLLYNISMERVLLPALMRQFLVVRLLQFSSTNLYIVHLNVYTRKILVSTIIYWEFSVGKFHGKNSRNLAKITYFRRNNEFWLKEESRK